jgi:Putative peptidoglycan binding domain
MPNRPYVVRQGDHLRKIAVANAFDADTVWADPANADLKKLRVTYNLLLPGDVVQIPDGTPAGTPLDTGATNTFTAAAAKPCTITHAFVRGGVPVANATYWLVGSVDDSTSKTTDGNGMATFDVPADADSVQVRFQDGSSYVLMVGYLDPVATPPGAEQRLIHLGYLDEGDPVDDDDASRAGHDACVALGLAAFQGDNGLPPTGVLDDATAQKLASVYGC